MGVLRILLALAILIDHYKIMYGHFTLTSLQLLFHYVNLRWISIRVNAFFIISGFYTQMLLEEKFARGCFAALKFYLYRLIRLMPDYYLILAITLCLLLFWPHFDGMVLDWNCRPTSRCMAINPHFWRNNLLVIDAKRFPGAILPQQRLVIDRAWSLSIELALVLLAPLLMRRTLTFWLATAGSIGMAIYCLLTKEGVTYRFAPIAIYFMLGAMGYKFYRGYLKDAKISGFDTFVAYCIVAYIGAVLLYYDWLTARFGIYPVYFASIGGIAVAIPFIAVSTKNLRIDRFIGQLSYPMYLAHVLVFAIVEKLHIGWRFCFSVLACFIWSLICYLLIDRPLAHFRRRRIAAPVLSFPPAEHNDYPELERI